jgi:UDP-glucose 4-epimerase
LALSVLDEKSATYNLGCSGEGYSVRQVIDIAREITGKEIPVKVGPRRPGDPAVLIAGSEEIKRNLGWSPRFGDLRLIVESAWRLMKIKGIDDTVYATGARA